MMRQLPAILTCLLLALAAAGCAGTDDTFVGAQASLPAASGASVETPATPLQCVPYARAHSGVRLYGDAATWWARADGRYTRSHTPVVGSVLVLTGYAGPDRGHLAVVRRLVSPREVRLDHANWLGDGAIYLNDPAFDVSADNDWSAVRIWNARTRAWGLRTYSVEGFIGPDAVSRSDVVAQK